MSIPPEILSPRREWPISPSEISPLKLGQFLGFNLRVSFSYSKIFSALELLSRNEQEKLLIAFFTKGVKDFPNAERFAKELVRINNIKLFKPREEPDTAVLQAFVNQHLDRLGSQRVLIRIIPEDEWELAEDAELDVSYDDTKSDARRAAMDLVVGRGETAGEAAWYAPRDASRSALGSAVFDVIWSVALNKTRGLETESDVVRDMAGYLTWIIVEDKMAKKGNPFSPLIAIYELGFLPIGLVENAKGEMEFAIFAPPIQKAATQ